MGEERTGRNLGRTMKELREAKGFTHEDLAARISVSPETVERWEKVGFGVQRGTRAAHKFYSTPTFEALLRVLDAAPGDLDKEMSNRTLQPGDSVVRPIDEGRPALRENVTGEAEFLVVPDGFGGTFLKEMQDVTDADYKAIKTYLEEEAAFLEAESGRLMDNHVREQTINMDLDLELKSLLEEDEPGA